MYLMLAAFIASGIEGVREVKALEWKDFQGCPSNVDEKSRGLSGIRNKLPKDLRGEFESIEGSQLEQLWF